MRLDGQTNFCIFLMKIGALSNKFIDFDSDRAHRMIASVAIHMPPLVYCSTRTHKQGWLKGSETWSLSVLRPPNQMRLTPSDQIVAVQTSA